MSAQNFCFLLSFLLLLIWISSCDFVNFFYPVCFKKMLWYLTNHNGLTNKLIDYLLFLNKKIMSNIYTFRSYKFKNKEMNWHRRTVILWGGKSHLVGQNDQTLLQFLAINEFGVFLDVLGWKTYHVHQLFDLVTVGSETRSWLPVIFTPLNCPS